MTPEQAFGLLAQVVAQTRALPQEVDAMREALRVLKPRENKPDA
jgi:antitoxin component of RelBE/YafQ-DinJ toxin-antitoxin module